MEIEEGSVYGKKGWWVKVPNRYTCACYFTKEEYRKMDQHKTTWQFMTHRQLGKFLREKV